VALLRRTSGQIYPLSQFERGLSWIYALQLLARKVTEQMISQYRQSFSAELARSILDNLMRKSHISLREANSLQTFWHQRGY
jgi:hypothetical protein